MSDPTELFRQMYAEIQMLRIAVISILEKSTPEVRLNFARAMNATLDAKEANPGPEADRLVRIAAELQMRVMPDLKP